MKFLCKLMLTVIFLGLVLALPVGFFLSVKAAAVLLSAAFLCVLVFGLAAIWDF